MTVLSYKQMQSAEPASLVSVDATANSPCLPRFHQALLIIVVVLLAVPYVPHEFLISGPATTGLTLVLMAIVVAVVRRGGSVPERVLWAAIALIAWIGVRLLVVPATGFNEEHLDLVGAAREMLPLVVGLLLMRSYGSVASRTVLLRTLPYVLILLTVFEVYQTVVGGTFLQGLGYTTPTFNFYTEAGEIRPFGTFYSPTMFAPYLAMVGIVVIFTASRRYTQLFWLVLVTAAILLTQTRATWIGFSISIVACLAFSGKRMRDSLIMIMITVAPALIACLVLFPSVSGAIAGRADSIVGADESNTVRIELWNGTIAASQDSPLLGHGHNPFVTVMQKYVGNLAKYGHAHSNFFETLYLYGTIGLGLFLILMLCIASALLRARRSALNVAGIGVFIIFVIDSIFEATWGNFNVTVTFLLLVALGFTGASIEPTKPKNLSSENLNDVRVTGDPDFETVTFRT